MERGAPAGEAAADGPRAALPRLAAVKDR